MESDIGPAARQMESAIGQTGLDGIGHRNGTRGVTLGSLDGSRAIPMSARAVLMPPAMMMKTLTLGTFALVSLATACTDLEAPEDGADETAVDGKADSGYSKCQLDAVVSWLNGPVTSAQMIDAGVNTRAARNLAKHRDGGDKKFGTADDNKFDNIAEVDAVPYVGPTTFKQLVEAVGDDACAAPSTDPFDPASCQGPAITQEQARTKLAGHYGYGAKNYVAGYEVMMRTRTCSDINNDATCGAWTTPVRAMPRSILGSYYYGGEVGTASFQDLSSPAPQTGLLLQGFLVADPTWHGSGYYDGEITCEDVTHPDSCKWTSCLSNTPRNTCGYGDYGAIGLRMGSYNTAGVEFSGTVTNTCARLTARPGWSLWNTQVEAAVLVRFEH